MKKVISLFLATVITVCLFSVSALAQSVEPSVEDVLYNGFSAYDSEIYVADYKLTVEEFKKALSGTKHLHPSAFHVSNRFSYYQYVENGVTYVYSMLPIYEIAQEEYEKQLKSFNFWIDEIVSKVPKDAIDLEKILFVHEYFAAHFEYDLSYQIYDAYNFLKYKTGVCQAYTLAFTAIMQRLGIFCTAAIDEPDNHCWNIVKLGNNYYHIDTTHDDPVCRVGDGTMSNMCRRDHLLLCDATMISLEQHRGGWYTVGGDFKCTDNSYENKIWQEYEQPTVNVGGEWYQISGGDFIWDNNIRCYTALLYKTDKNNNKTLFKTFNIPARIANGRYYGCNYNIFAVGDVIFGGGGNYIWRYSISKDEFNILCNTSQNIYEISYMGGGKIKLIINNGNGTYSFSRFDFLIGDSDDDGSVDVDDMVSLKKYILIRESDKNVGFMDLNGDCFVDVLDFIAIHKTVMG